jgi:excisionase family DNA binding protein
LQSLARHAKIFAFMTDVIGVKEAATLLETSEQTVRNLLHDGTLKGAQPSANRPWSIQLRSVEAFLSTHGPLAGGRRRKSRLASREAEINRLQADVRRLTAALGGADLAELVREREDLRGRVATLGDALARVRESAELQRAADEERARLVDRLVDALSHAERTDILRRRALEILEDGVAGAAVPSLPPSRRRR